MPEWLVRLPRAIALLLSIFFALLAVIAAIVSLVELSKSGNAPFFDQAIVLLIIAFLIEWSTRPKTK